MSLNIKNAETVALAEEVARLAGTTKTGAIRDALRLMRDRLAGERAAVPTARERLSAIAGRVQAMPDLKPFSVDDLYGPDGTWK